MYKQISHPALYDFLSTSYPAEDPSSQVETNLISLSPTKGCNQSPCFWLTVHQDFILLKWNILGNPKFLLFWEAGQPWFNLAQVDRMLAIFCWIFNTKMGIMKFSNQKLSGLMIHFYNIVGDCGWFYRQNSNGMAGNGVWLPSAS